MHNLQKTKKNICFYINNVYFCRRNSKGALGFLSKP